MIDLTNDLHFKYVLTAKGKDSRKSLKGLAKAFTNTKTTNLTVKSPEITCGDPYQKSTRFDIYASFDANSNIDIEMQVVDNKKELIPRMIYYLSRIVSSQLEHGEEYTKLVKAYVLFICDFKYVEDKKLIHHYNLKDEEGNPLCKDRKEYVNMITVELPKLNGNSYPESLIEKYAYVIKYSSDDSKHDIIEKITEEVEGIKCMVKVANEITEEEKKWMESFNRVRALMDENQRVANAREDGKSIKEKEMILKASKAMSVQDIASTFDLEVNYVQQIIDDSKLHF